MLQAHPRGLKQFPVEEVICSSSELYQFDTSFAVYDDASWQRPKHRQPVNLEWLAQGRLLQQLAFQERLRKPNPFTTKVPATLSMSTRIQAK